MVTLVILIVTGIAAAWFATQNTQVTTLTLAQYSFTDIPVYLVVLGAVLLGILVSFVIHFFNSLGSTLALHGKEGTLASARKEITDLSKEVHQLQIENARLKTQLGEAGDDNSL